MRTLLVWLFFFSPLAAEEIALYYSPRCPSSQKVLTYLKKEKISIPLKDVTVSKEAKKELEVYGGYLIVPCLMVDMQPIYNAKDIIEWLQTYFHKE